MMSGLDHDSTTDAGLLLGSCSVNSDLLLQVGSSFDRCFVDMCNFRAVLPQASVSVYTDLDMTRLHKVRRCCEGAGVSWHDCEPVKVLLLAINSTIYTLCHEVTRRVPCFSAAAGAVAVPLKAHTLGDHAANQLFRTQRQYKCITHGQSPTNNSVWEHEGHTCTHVQPAKSA